LVESVAVTVKEDVPVWVAVPERSPAGVSVKPDGGDPAVTAKVTAPVPPVAVMACEYATPAVPDGSVVGERVRGVEDEKATLATNGVKPV
jgi:hypothetical protein